MKIVVSVSLVHGQIDLRYNITSITRVNKNYILNVTVPTIYSKLSFQFFH